MTSTNVSNWLFVDNLYNGIETRYKFKVAQVNLKTEEHNGSPKFFLISDKH